mmetsp:Transcript_55036/g.119988  ORF Transcript_55036/g.119988 Transcript_55036/m.119988 type:complete len:330 (+) Transcript_55036:62-1051(+)
MEVRVHLRERLPERLVGDDARHVPEDAVEPGGVLLAEPRRRAEQLQPGHGLAVVTELGRHRLHKLQVRRLVEERLVLHPHHRLVLPDRLAAPEDHVQLHELDVDLDEGDLALELVGVQGPDVDPLLPLLVPQVRLQHGILRRNLLRDPDRGGEVPGGQVGRVHVHGLGLRAQGAVVRPDVRQTVQGDVGGEMLEHLPEGLEGVDLPVRSNALGQRHREASHVRADVDHDVALLAERLQGVRLPQVERAELADGAAHVDVQRRRHEEVRQLPVPHVAEAAELVGEVLVPASVEPPLSVGRVAAELLVRALRPAQLLVPAPLLPSGGHGRA